jgi:Protein of unknown function (DUF4435)
MYWRPSTVIAYLPDHEIGRAYLLRHYNDIDVYVEDAACRNMYLRLINRILTPHGHSISTVFPLHGRSKVLETCAGDQVADRPRLYIIDGDLDLLLGNPAPNLKHLYRLDVYCAENLLLSERAAVTVATECHTDTYWGDLAVMLGLRPLFERCVSLLAPLFVVYAVIYSLDLPIDVETVNYPVQRLLIDANDPATLSRQRIRARIAELLERIRGTVPREAYRKTRNTVVGTLRRNTSRHAAYISAKRYLFPLLHCQLRRIVKLRDPEDQLKVRLAAHCELDIDAGLRNAVLDALRGGS